MFNEESQAADWIFRYVNEALADLEKYFDIPPFSINADDLLFVQRSIRGNKTEIFLAFVTVADIDNFSGNDLPVLYNINDNRKQVS